MACPHVSGSAALLLSKNNSFDNEIIRTLICSSVDEISSPKFIGNGRINAYKAITREASIRLVPLNSELATMIEI